MPTSYPLEEDTLGRPVPQYENAGGTDTEVWKGSNGAGWVGGDEAHDAPDAGQPIKIGGKASTSTPVAVADADRVDAWFDLNGRLHVILDLGVAGDIAHDAVDSGNPIKVGGKAQDPTALPADVAAGDRVNMLFDLKGRPIVDTELPAAAALGDGDANPTTPIVGTGEMLYNGTTWDRKRNNLQGTLFASAPQTATQTSADQINYNGRGIHVILDVTASAATPSIVLKIEGKSASGVYYTLLEGAAVIGVSTNVYKVMPWAANVANVSAADLLPKTWRVVVTHADGDSITYSVDFAIDC